MNWGLLLPYVQSFFISVATILGTGILGLPLRVYSCGFWPFVATFVPSLLVQIVLVHFFLEILQICSAALDDSLHRDEFAYNSLNDVPLMERTHSSKAAKAVSYQKDEISSLGISQPSETNSTSSSESNEGGDSPTAQTEQTHVTANLHMLGKLFLPVWFQVVFYISLAMIFPALLTSYALAGGESFGQLLQVDFRYLIPPFVWVLAFVIVFGFAFVQPIITTLTLAKGTIFVLMAVVGVLVGGEIDNHVTTDWSETRKPLLMETVALGGLPLVMPIMYGRFRGDAAKLKSFKHSIYLALVFSAFLNVIWAWSVLKVVPQFDLTCMQPSSNRSAGATTTVPPTTVPLTTMPAPQTQDDCDPLHSLQAADLNGFISTVPFTAMVKAYNPQLEWVSVLVEWFVLVSITVSFLTIGASMYHSIIGVVDYLISRRRTSATESRPLAPQSTVPRCLSKDSLLRAVCGLAAFLVIFSIAIAQPKSFVKLLDKVVSTGGNVVYGPVVWLMYARACRPPYNQLIVPLRTPPALRWPIHLVALYFTAAVFYMIVDSLVEALAA